MRRACAVLLAMGGAAAVLRAQEDPFAMPRDAGAMLAWHLNQEATPASWEALLSRLYRYFQSGAHAQAAAAAAQMEQIDAGNPDAQRFQAYLAYRATRALEPALAATADWLRRYEALGAPGQPMSGQVAEMHRFRAELEAERARLATVARAQSRARWLPFAGLALLGAFATVVARGTRQG